MTITLELSTEQENRLRAGAARHDAQTVREVLLQAVDSTVEGLLRTSDRGPKGKRLSALLDQIAAGLHDAPALPDEAVSRAGIYADHLCHPWLTWSTPTSWCGLRHRPILVQSRGSDHTEQ